MISRNQPFHTKSAYKPKSLEHINNIILLYILNMCLYSCVQNFMKNINFGVDFDQYFYVSIDFVLNIQIENIGQNQHPKLIFFS